MTVLIIYYRLYIYIFYNNLSAGENFCSHC